jgi:shikimate dehydrogenase
MRPITGTTRVFAVLGSPVSHSLSPAMHNGWLETAGIDAAYVALDVREEAFAALPSLGFAGVNVTVPFKEKATAIATKRDEAVALLGAANVLTFAGGEIEAFNTDAPGFVASLDEDAPGWRSSVRTALVLGAGGAARAIAFGLSQASAPRIVIANRAYARAEAAARLIPGTVASRWEDLADAFAGADLIVNATSAGLSGLPSPDWPMHAAPRSAIVADAVYKPLETPLLRAARAHGLASVDGLGMLIHQGAAAFRIWFGVQPDAHVARRRLEAILRGA